jgi:hypothetical protein
MAACIEPENRCIIMELAEIDLFALNKTDRPLSVPQRVRMALDAASGLLHVHSSRPALIHRFVTSPIKCGSTWGIRLLMPFLYAET